MIKTAKLLTLVTLTCTLFMSIGIVSISDYSKLDVHASECSHVGNHYECLQATTKQSGIKEYWVCCKCHQHYLEEPNGVWNDAGQASITITSSDDRYIPKTNEYNEEGFKLSSDGKTIEDYNGTDKDVVIPEGVETIGSSAFSGSNITSITLPSTLKEIEKDAFKNTDNLTSIVIPGSVEDIAKNAFLDNPSGIESLFGVSGRNITIYLEITKAEADAQFEKGWDNAGTSSIWGGSKTFKATVYYKGQWHYNENGEPVPNNK